MTLAGAFFTPKTRLKSLLAVVSLSSRELLSRHSAQKQGYAPRLATLPG